MSTVTDVQSPLMWMLAISEKCMNVYCTSLNKINAQHIGRVDLTPTHDWHTNFYKQHVNKYLFPLTCFNIHIQITWNLYDYIYKKYLLYKNAEVDRYISHSSASYVNNTMNDQLHVDLYNKITLRMETFLALSRYNNNSSLHET